jgi:hypothetical protein
MKLCEADNAAIDGLYLPAYWFIAYLLLCVVPGVADEEP